MNDTRKNEGLQALGAKTQYSDNYTPEVLECFQNQHPGNDYWVRFNCPEFTSLCPITGHEDCVNIIMKDLIKLMAPKYIEVTGRFTPRGGISIHPYANYGIPGTKWERMAEDRLMHMEK